jgi:hypothetical protein
MTNSNRTMIATMLAAAGLLAACAAEAPRVPADTTTRAQAALAPFKKELMGALQEALQRGGPEEAIDVCRLKAPEIAESAAGDGLRVGRTSHRLRNSANSPPPWTAAFLAEYQADPSDVTPRTVRIDREHVGYVEPIHVKPLCLACHGQELAAPVQDRLRELYPGDAATGFRKDDFRGLFWVELKVRDPA